MTTDKLEACDLKIRSELYQHHCSKLSEAVYSTVHGYPGGAEVLAMLIGLPLADLIEKADPGVPRHFDYNELLQLQMITADPAITAVLLGALESPDIVPIRKDLHMQKSAQEILSRLFKMVRQIDDPEIRATILGSWCSTSSDPDED